MTFYQRFTKALNKTKYNGSVGRAGRFTGQLATRLMHFEKFVNQQIEDFQKNKDNDDPLEESAIAILQKVFEQFQVFPDDLEALPDVPEAFLQIKGPFQTQVDLVKIFVFPGLGWRVENVEVFGDAVLQVEGLADIYS
jgi:hypothetical protein